MADDAKPLVIQTEDLSEEPARWLGERCELVRCSHLDQPQFGNLLARAQGLVVRTYTPVDEHLLDQAPHLKVVGRAGVALENIDIGACRKRGVEVVHTPGSNTRAVVEYVTLLMIDALRPREYVAHAVNQGDWNAMRQRNTTHRQLSDMTIGILGFGKIGTGVARVAKALDMRVLYNDVREITEDQQVAGCESVSPEQLFADADIVTVHIDARSSNTHFVHAKLLSTMKQDVTFLNTSRGFVLDPFALADAMLKRPQAQALIDVHDPHEPVDGSYPLLDIENVTLLPHLASCTQTAKTNMSWVVRDVWRVITGEQPEWAAPSWDT
ncbi:MAG: hypothetical protein H6815_02930 [Phycisphaeraceae bacterium]|nr:hypothetical protein [Phycisphaerales bacterium]MCB9859381.1 hypothetical protein [Phycisphaeraceae bacterium]